MPHCPQPAAEQPRLSSSPAAGHKAQRCFVNPHVCIAKSTGDALVQGSRYGAAPSSALSRAGGPQWGGREHRGAERRGPHEGTRSCRAPVRPQISQPRTLSTSKAGGEGAAALRGPHRDTEPGTPLCHPPAQPPTHFCQTHRQQKQSSIRPHFPFRGRKKGDREERKRRGKKRKEKKKKQASKEIWQPAVLGRI